MILTVMDKYLKTLELDKILEMLAGPASHDENRRMALALRPVQELQAVSNEPRKTDQARQL